MKQIVPLGNNRYVHLDSYLSHNETRGGQFILLSLAVFIAALTVGGMCGIDITQPQPEINHGRPAY